jgi:hypothetical protein
MRKLILCAALIVISLQGSLYAQDDNESSYYKLMNRSKTEQTFNLWPSMVGIRAFVVLNEGRLILDLSRLDDFENFRSLDSVLVSLRKDIAFYKDSLDAFPASGWRIDYVLNTEYSSKKIRFIKHESAGNSFLNREGDISRLKFEQDTVRIIIQKSMPGIGNKTNPCMIPYSIQATFVLGNYYDIDKIVSSRELAGIIDTLQATAETKKKQKYYFLKPITIVYNPYFNGPQRLKKYNDLLNNEYSMHGTSGISGNSRISFNPQFGAGIMRNNFVPVADVAFAYNRYWNNYKDRNIFKISGTGYYFFDKDEKGNFIINDNWFISATIGSIYSRANEGWYGRECTIGAGYLVSRKGNYFKNNTFRVFTDIMIVKGVSLVPEVIVTDNFKQIFPGLTLKVFQ